MTEAEFVALRERVKGGDNTALSCLHPFQDGCIRMLVVKSDLRCNQDQAYDIFVDSILDFRKNLLHDKIEFQNIQAYLRRICWNKWLALVRSHTRIEGKRETVTSLLYDDSQTETNMEDLYTTRLKHMEEAMAQLNEQCRKILYMAIADEQSMAQIAQQLGMASADVAKTTKSRCYKKLIEIIRAKPKP